MIMGDFVAKMVSGIILFVFWLAALLEGKK
jgi:hypothetical protein